MTEDSAFCANLLKILTNIRRDYPLFPSGYFHPSENVNWPTADIFKSLPKE